MIRRLVFLVDSPFNKRDYQRYGIDLLSLNNFDVEVWDLTRVLNPKFAEAYTPPDPIDWPGCIIFEDKRKALKKIKELPSDTFIFNYIIYMPRSLSVYKAISCNKAHYAIHMANALPTAEFNSHGDYKPSFTKRIKKLTKQGLTSFFQSLQLTIFYHTPYFYRGLKSARIILAGGEDCFKYYYPINNDTEILWVHTFDYDLYLEGRDCPCEERYTAVFLDEYVPFHSDFTEFNLKPPLTAEKYYPIINRFFDLVEENTNLKVVIAAHPRSQYEHHPDYYKGRKCIRGETAQLVRESRLVITHMSTALNFVNLYMKPAIFITTSDWENGPYWADVKIMASWFGKKPIYMDNDPCINWEKEMKVNTILYKCYRQAYIKTKFSEDLPFWQIVADRIKQGGFDNKSIERAIEL